MKKQCRSEGDIRRWGDAQGCFVKPSGRQVLWKQDMNYQEPGLAGGVSLSPWFLPSVPSLFLFSARMPAVGHPSTDGLPHSWLSHRGVARLQRDIDATAALGGL